MKARYATIVGGHMTRVPALERLQTAMYDLDMAESVRIFTLRYAVKHPEELGDALSISGLAILHSAAPVAVQAARPHYQAKPGIDLKIAAMCGSEARSMEELVALAQYKTIRNADRAVRGPHRAGHLGVLATNFAEVPQPKSVTLLPRISRVSTTALLKEMNHSGIPVLRANASKDEFYPLRILPELVHNPDEGVYSRVVGPEDSHDGQPIGHWHDSPLACPKGWLNLVNEEFLQT